MIKVIGTDSFNFDQPSASLVDLHSRGVDRDWMTKRAAVFINELKEIRPEPGHSYIHLISLGAGEYSGANRNGDWWNEKSSSFDLPEPKNGVGKIIKLAGGLEEFHPTFMKGHVFKNHRNGNPEYAIGEIKYAAYNPEMHRGELIIKVPHGKEWDNDLQKMANGESVPFSMAAKEPHDQCLAADTLILTERGYKPIKDIVPGERVLTHKARFKAVKATIKTPGIHKVLCIETNNSTDILRVTAGHPFYAISGVCATANQRTWRRPVEQNSQITTLYGYEPPSFVPADRLSDSDVCLFPQFNGTRKPVYDPWLIGLYLADGCVFGEKTNKKLRRKGLAKGRWKLRGVSWTLGLDKVNLKIADILIEKLVSIGLSPKCYPAGSDRKAVQVTVYSMELAAFLSGRFGRKRKKRVGPEAFFWSKDDKRKLISGWLDGDGSQDPKKGSVRGMTVLKGLADSLLAFSVCAGVPAACHRESLIDHPWSASEYLYVLHFGRNLTPLLAEHSLKISSVEHGKRGPWYFTVDQGAGLYKRGVEYFGVTIKKITEAEVDTVYNLSVEDDESYVAGLAIVHNCSICGNVAPSRSQYCDHLRNNMTDLTKEGHQVFAINDQYNFFDISKVFRPADRIAWGLSKVASAVRGGAELAESYGLTEAYSLTGVPSKHASAKRAIARKLAEIEKTIEARPTAMLSVAGGCPGSDMSDDAVKTMKRHPLLNVLSALGNQKIALALRPFTQLVMGDRIDDIVIPTSLPGIFTKMSDSELDEVSDSGTYDVGTDMPVTELRSLMNTLSAEHSMQPGPVHQRVTESIIRGTGPCALAKSGSAVDPRSIPVVKEYAKYLLSFVKHASGAEETVPLLTLLRNYRIV